MPEMSLSTPTRTTSPEISACADAQAVHDKANTSQTFRPFIVPSSNVSTRILRFLSASNLAFRQAQDEPIDLRRQLDLAGQAAVRQPFGGRAVEQRVLLVAHGRQAGEPGLVDIDMAGGAKGGAGAFRGG